MILLAFGSAAVGEPAHLRTGQGVELVRLRRLLRVLGIHHRAEPDVLDLDVLEPLLVETLDVILVPVRGDDQIETLLARRVAVGQHRGLEILDGLLEQLRAPLLAAVDENVEIVLPLRDADVNAIAAADAVSPNQEIISHGLAPGWSSSS